MTKPFVFNNTKNKIWNQFNTFHRKNQYLSYTELMDLYYKSQQ